MAFIRSLVHALWMLVTVIPWGLIMVVSSLWKRGIPLYWRLISEFKRLTGVPAVLNTSLNIKGEPMICEPRDAIRCFFDCGMDYLALGSYLLAKERE